MRKSEGGGSPGSPRPRASMSGKSWVHSPQGWFTTSETLWAAARQLQLTAERAIPKYNALSHQATALYLLTGSNTPEQLRLSKAAQHQHRKLDIFRVAAMLRAMSIEADLKGGYYTKMLEAHGHVDAFPSLKSHNLTFLAKHLRAPLTNGEMEYLPHLEKMLQRGRFPATFGNQVSYSTHPATDARIRSKIRRKARNCFARYMKASAAPRIVPEP